MKTDMQAGQFRFANSEAMVSGWKDGRYDFYLNDGHHRMNAALEIYWETGDDQFVSLLIQHGRWHGSKPLFSRRLPTRNFWYKLRAALGWQ